jgi:hypothetical protein
MQPGEEPSPGPTGQPSTGPQGSWQAPGPAFGYPGEPSGAGEPGGAAQGAWRERMLASSPRPVRAYVAEVGALASAPPESARAQTATVEATRSMAAALRAIPAPPGRVYSAATTIETQASRMERATTGAARASAAKDALAEAIGALEAVRRERPDIGLDQPLSQARAAADRIDPSAPFQQQRAAITEALQSVGDALMLAGQEPQKPRQDQRGTQPEEKQSPEQSRPDESMQHQTP